MEYFFGTKFKPEGLDWGGKKAAWKQVHGTKIVELRSEHLFPGECDGLWTREPNLTIGVVTADCVPILAYSDDAVAALHAGWRGVYANIAEKFFNLPEVASRKWKVILGPSIRTCCYEVSSELIEQFARTYPEIPHQNLEPAFRRLDLIAVLKAQLQKFDSILDLEIHPDCTFCARDLQGEFKYFSYRRGDRDSRQFSQIRL